MIRAIQGINQRRRLRQIKTKVKSQLRPPIILSRKRSHPSVLIIKSKSYQSKFLGNLKRKSLSSSQIHSSQWVHSLMVAVRNQILSQPPPQDWTNRQIHLSRMVPLSHRSQISHPKPPCLLLVSNLSVQHQFSLLFPTPIHSPFNNHKRLPSKLVIRSQLNNKLPPKILIRLLSLKRQISSNSLLDQTSSLKSNLTSSWPIIFRLRINKTPSLNFLSNLRIPLLLGNNNRAVSLVEDSSLRTSLHSLLPSILSLKISRPVVFNRTSLKAKVLTDSTLCSHNQPSKTHSVDSQLKAASTLELTSQQP